MPSPPSANKHKTQGAVLIDLSAAIISIDGKNPICRLVSGGGTSLDRLPFGPFFPPAHRTMENGLRQWVTQQVGVKLAHVEQLYTFGDRGRHAVYDTDEEEHIVSVGYIALSPPPHPAGLWRGLYDFFPWEDWRQGRPHCLDEFILPKLDIWVKQDTNARDRIKIAFGRDGLLWDEEHILERYELLYQAGLVREATYDKHHKSTPPYAPGIALQFDHRRILATAMGRLRGKMKYRPVIFDLMPAQFTLTQLQNTAEAILGFNLHKQNFRRLVEKSKFLEPTGESSITRGRPAELFRFRHEEKTERPLPGLRIATRRK